MRLTEMFCNKLYERLEGNTAYLDASLEETVSSLIWVTPFIKSKVPALKSISRELTSMYGSIHAEAAINNENDMVCRELIQQVRFAEGSEDMMLDRFKNVTKNYNMSEEQRYKLELEFSSTYAADTSNDNPKEVFSSNEESKYNKLNLNRIKNFMYAKMSSLKLLKSNNGTQNSQSSSYYVGLKVDNSKEKPEYAAVRKSVNTIIDTALRKYKKQSCSSIKVVSSFKNCAHEATVLPKPSNSQSTNYTSGTSFDAEFSYNTILVKGPEESLPIINDSPIIIPNVEIPNKSFEIGDADKFPQINDSSVTIPHSEFLDETIGCVETDKSPLKDKSARIITDAEILRENIFPVAQNSASEIENTGTDLSAELSTKTMTVKDTEESLPINDSPINFPYLEILNERFEFRTTDEFPQINDSSEPTPHSEILDKSIGYIETDKSPPKTEFTRIRAAAEILPETTIHSNHDQEFLLRKYSTETVPDFKLLTETILFPDTDESSQINGYTITNTDAEILNEAIGYIAKDELPTKTNSTISICESEMLIRDRIDTNQQTNINSNTSSDSEFLNQTTIEYQDLEDTIILNSSTMSSTDSKSQNETTIHSNSHENPPKKDLTRKGTDAKLLNETIVKKDPDDCSKIIDYSIANPDYEILNKTVIINSDRNNNSPKIHFKITSPISELLNETIMDQNPEDCSLIRASTTSSLDVKVEHETMGYSDQDDHRGTINSSITNPDTEVLNTTIEMSDLNQHQSINDSLITYSKDEPFKEIIRFHNSKELSPTRCSSITDTDIENEILNRYPLTKVEINFKLSKMQKILLASSMHTNTELLNGITVISNPEGLLPTKCSSTTNTDMELMNDVLSRHKSPLTKNERNLEISETQKISLVSNIKSSPALLNEITEFSPMTNADVELISDILRQDKFPPTKEEINFELSLMQNLLSESNIDLRNNNVKCLVNGILRNSNPKDADTNKELINEILRRYKSSPTKEKKDVELSRKSSLVCNINSSPELLNEITEIPNLNEFSPITDTDIELINDVLNRHKSPKMKEGINFELSQAQKIALVGITTAILISVIYMRHSSSS
ncbi:hypothetical protein JTE90_009632 [Oedothorax gibbosus]|uniref:IST1 homolog n=1 Tax=Oedothorax gibbosus TaxID=931172 RepID=A0AAV6V9U8_9ARAC|nr:hypothetical protein JTE90_009632 [Oedothorax gibbosus]